MKTLTKLLFALALVISFSGLFTSSALAVGNINVDKSRVSNIPEVTNPSTVLGNVLNAVYILAGSIAIITLIIAGILYITSDGDSSKVSTAKSAVIYSVVGLIIVGLAFIITGIVQNIANT